MLWVETAPELQKEVFAEGAGELRNEQVRTSQIEYDLLAPLFIIGALAKEPLSVDGGRLQYACRRIAAWAEAEGVPATRLAFEQTIALLRPRDAAAALSVARIARDLGEHPRAESWFRHAVWLARHTDWESYVWAFVGLGVLYIRSGNYAAASSVMGRALRTAERYGFLALAGVAHHHLFHLKTEAGEIRRGYEHARAALDSYGPHHPQRPALAHDVGRFWLHIGQFERAIPLFTTAVLLVEDPNLRSLMYANTARAAGGAGDRTRYAQARSAALALAGEARGRTWLADAYEALAYADLSMGEWDRARDTAGMALQHAVASGNAEVRVNVDALYERACARRVPELRPSDGETPGVARQAERLAENIVAALSAADG